MCIDVIRFLRFRLAAVAAVPCALWTELNLLHAPYELNLLLQVVAAVAAVVRFCLCTSAVCVCVCV
jgi:hypothetical protein